MDDNSVGTDQLVNRSVTIDKLDVQTVDWDAAVSSSAIGGRVQATVSTAFRLGNMVFFRLKIEALSVHTSGFSLTFPSVPRLGLPVNQDLYLPSITISGASDAGRSMRIVGSNIVVDISQGSGSTWTSSIDVSGMYQV